MGQYSIKAIGHPPETHFNLSVLGHFVVKSKKKKIDKIHKDIWTISSIHG